MTRFIHLVLSVLAASAILAVAGCAAHHPPQDLVDAHAAYERASKGPPAELSPTALYDAKKALDEADKSFAEEHGSDQTADLAYLALRKTQIAETKGNIEVALRTKIQAEKAEQEHTRRELSKTRTALSEAHQQMEKTAQQLEAEKQGRLEADKRAQDTLERTTQQVETEKQGRLEAEKKAQDALDRLNKIASVKKEDRGTVITLSGSVVFASGRSTILASARPRLDEVALVLKESEGQSFVVEGHTDSRGSAEMNQELSQRRAQVVRDYLVEQGVTADRIRAVGFGKLRPVADNDTAEGRANNRRVEIVVQRLPSS